MYININRDFPVQMQVSFYMAFAMSIDCFCVRQNHTKKLRCVPRLCQNCSNIYLWFFCKSVFYIIC